jgi:long-subunit fatty acid transport protein
MKLRRICGLALILALGLQVRVAWGDGLIRDGVGPISTGRGGTNQGFADNAAIILDNPGAMVNVAGNGLGEIGVDTVITSVQYSDPFNDVQSKTRPLPTPMLGYIQKSDDGQWAWGIGAFVPAGFGASYGVLNNPLFGPNLTRSIGAMGKLLPGLSYRATDRLSIGITVGVAISDVELHGPLFLQQGPLAGLPAIVNLQGIGVAPTGSLGMQYQLTPDDVIGATYTEQTNFNLAGGAETTLLIPGLGATGADFDSKIRMKWPRSVAVGIKHSFCPHRRIAADVIWYDWAHAFNQVDLQFYNPTNPLIPLLTPLPIKDALPLNWTNSVSLRLGYEWQPTDLETWRVGYTYHGSPVPDSTLNPYLDGVLEHGFSVGYSRQMRRAVLNLAYQYNFGKQRNVGTSALVGGQFDNTSLNAQAQFAMISLLFPF